MYSIQVFCSSICILNKEDCIEKLEQLLAEESFKMMKMNPTQNLIQKTKEKKIIKCCEDTINKYREDKHNII